MTELRDVAYAAQLTGFGAEAIRRAIKRGELIASKLCGQYRMTDEALEQWIESMRVAPETAASARSADRTRRAPAPVGGSFRQRARARRGPR